MALFGFTSKATGTKLNGKLMIEKLKIKILAGADLENIKILNSKTLLKVLLQILRL